MNVERMTKSIEILQEALKDERAKKFNMDSWGYTKDKRPKAKCNTQACAFGTIALSKAFKELKIKFNFIVGQEWDDKLKKYIKVPGKRYEIIIVDSGGREDIDAAEAFYDINNATAEWLFMPYSYNVAEGPAALKEVISRMKRLLSYEKLENQIEVLEDRQRKLNVVP